MFVDDTKVHSVIVGDGSAIRLQSCLDFISSWSIKHWSCYLANVLRCHSVTKCLYNGTLKHFDYQIDNFVLPSVDRMTDLGVSYDLNFNFRPHIRPNDIVAKASLRAKLILKYFRIQITATSGFSEGLLYFRSSSFTIFQRNMEPILSYWHWHCWKGTTPIYPCSIFLKTFNLWKKTGCTWSTLFAYAEIKDLSFLLLENT